MMRYLRLAAILTIALFAAPMAGAQTIPGLGGGSAASSEEAAPDAAVAAIDAQVDALLDLLRNPGVLEALSARIEAAVPDAAAEEAPVEEPRPASLGRQVADITTSVAEDVGRSLDRLWIGVKRLPTILDRSVSAFDMTILRAAATELLMVVLLTYAVFLTLRLFGRRLDAAIAHRVRDGHAAVLFAYALLAALKDLVIVAVAWAAGYGLLIAFAGGENGISDIQALYLNAFLLVESAKIAIRTVLSPRVPRLRLVDVPDRGARVASRWLAVCTSILGYGLMLVVPMVNANASVLAGSAVGTLISILVVLSAIAMVIWYRRAVNRWLVPEDGSAGTFKRALAPLWFVPVLLYLIGLLTIVTTRPGGILVPLLQNTGVILGTILIAMIVFRFLTGAIARGVILPDSWKARFPLLERRLNSFVPKLLMLLRAVLFALVVAVILDVLGAINIVRWLDSDMGRAVVASAISVLLILLVAFAIWIVLSSWVEFRLNPDFGRPASAREQTLLTLLRNAATIALLLITLMIVLSEMGLNIGPLLASAGVLGLAIGFGAQKMVQDIITGVFIQFENAINVGDVISVGGITGAVERLTVRSVSLRDVHGVFHIIPFSSVDLVSNYMREFSYHVCDMGIAYREDIEEAKVAMHDAFDELRREEIGRGILGELEWFGLNSFGDSAIVLRARIKTLPGQQWPIGRAYNLILKRIFDERSIEIPYPHQTIYFGEDKHGKAPPMRILAEKVASARSDDEPEAGRPPSASDLSMETDPHKSMPDEGEVPDADSPPR